MRKNSLITIVILLIFSSLMSVKARHQMIVDEFEKGNKQAVQDSLSAFKQYDSEDTAFYNLYMGKIETNLTTAETFFLKAIKEGRKGAYYEDTCLEMGKIRFFQRRYSDAVEYLQHIRSIPEAHFWLARAYYKTGKQFERARSEAAVYISASTDDERKKLAYFTIADSWADNYRYPEAIKALNNLANAYPDMLQSQYYLLKMGNYIFKTEKPNDSYEYYKQVVSIDRFTPYAYEAEKQLYILKTMFKSSVDLSCLYPEGEIEPDKKPQVTIKEEPIVEVPKKEEIKPEIREDIVATFEAMKPVKINKPEKGMYLQLGRFSVEKNANQVVEKVRNCKINSCYYIANYQDQDTFVVLAGPFATGTEAGAAKKILKELEINSFLRVVNE
ncbi:MAG: SPOR domain-containing protein [Candidatus Cloacimonetes bacterium]|nr:SPOR domain-containing protein [Candidatus Cloacimonadota bacterium]